VGRARLSQGALAALLVAGALVFLLQGEEPSNGGSGDSGISRTEAAEIEETFDDVEDGRPYEYDQDGDVFRNDEMLLPDHPRGYYREFTVETPGENDRGERRLVIGGGWEAFYTEDHYESFVPIEPEDYSARLP
jgi:ribonuclease T1